MRALAEACAPPCPECGNPITRVENSWFWDPFYEVWRLEATKVCCEGHRSAVEMIA